MRKSILLFIAWMIWTNGNAQSGKMETALHIIPEPVSASVKKGEFIVKQNTRITASDPRVSDVANMLATMLNFPTGYNLEVRQSNLGSGKNSILLRLNATPVTALGKEGYTLQVTRNQVVIAANNPQGLFYGIQSLMQLLPPDISKKSVVQGIQWSIPAVEISDYPRFGWRGLMLDVSRHFFPKAFIEQYIDEMVKYKLNVFHWHLTDDRGWRIEIKGLPELTEVGAWLGPGMGSTAGFSFAASTPEEIKATRGGFYTQEDIREIVQYAQERFVTILPEIDVPGHSLALIIAYRNLSCTQLQYPIKEVFPDNALCIANDSTWLILDKIFTQVAALFPGEYIHVGGDEAFKGFWKKCPKDQTLMEREGITSLNGLQSYFEKKLEKLILSKGKKMIGWDEILEGGLAPEAAVMSWRGTKGGIEAARAGHHVVMAPNQFAYLDYCQGDRLIEPLPYNRHILRLSTSYQFEPVPEGVNAEYILGGQGNLWTQSTPNQRHAEYMTWPRGLALAEVLWSPRSKRNWLEFVRRMENTFEHMDAAGVKYARSVYDPVISAVQNADSSLQVKLTTEIPGLDIYYTFDGTDPDNFYPKYKGTLLDIPKDARQIRVITYRNGSPIGRQINCPVNELKNRIENP